MKHKVNFSLIFGILMMVLSVVFLVIAIVGLVT